MGAGGSGASLGGVFSRKPSGCVWAPKIFKLGEGQNQKWLLLETVLAAWRLIGGEQSGPRDVGRMFCFSYAFSQVVSASLEQN